MKIPKFKDEKIFELVFTHRSFLNEGGKGGQSNERLEFLGDSILSFVVSSYIYREYPDLKEGELTNLRAALTNTSALYVIAQKLDLGENLQLSKGEEASGGRSNRTILADTFEALLGGLFLDQGLLVTQKFIEESLLHDLTALIEKGLKDPKNQLQEITQKRHKISPTYRVIQEEGPDHSKSYTMGVFLAEEQLAEGTGKSKQEAEKVAAAAALAKLSEDIVE